MKEKIKNFFTNKTFWEYIIGFFVLFILLCFSYSKGFVDGVLIDDDIRTELIDTTTDSDLSNNDIKLNKKEAVNPQYFTFDVVYENIIGAGDNGSQTGISFNIVNRCSYSFTFELNETNIKLYSCNLRIFTNVLIFDNSIGLPVYVEAETIYSSPTLTLSKTGDDYFSFNKTDLLSVSLPLLVYEPNFDDIFLCTFFKLNNDIIYYNSYNDGAVILNNIITATSNWVTNNLDIVANLFQLTPNNFYDSTTTHFYSLNSVFNVNILNYYNNISYDSGYDYGYQTGYNQGLENGGFTGEDLQNAYDDGFQDGKADGYQDGKADGYQDGKADGYQDGKADGYQDGINKGKEIRDLEYQQSNAFFANVWDFIETATEKTLTIFNINILPGIPLYFLIVIPIAIGLIGWLFKLLQR